jgi:phospholipase C
VRIPTLAISAWIPARTVVTDEYRATSLLATMREHRNLGAPFTARDESARSFASLTSSSSPRPQEDWPEVIARPVPTMPNTLIPLDAPLGLIGRSLFLTVVALGAGLGATVPDIKPDEQITGAQAIAISHEALGDPLPRHAPEILTRTQNWMPDVPAPRGRTTARRSVIGVRRSARCPARVRPTSASHRG